MEHSIDLHGLTHDEALIKTEDAVLAASLTPGFTFEIITGKSPSLQEKITQMLDSHQFEHYIPNSNIGTIVVIEDVMF